MSIRKYLLTFVVVVASMSLYAEDENVPAEPEPEDSLSSSQGDDLQGYRDEQDSRAKQDNVLRKMSIESLIRETNLLDDKWVDQIQEEELKQMEAMYFDLNPMPLKEVLQVNTDPTAPNVVVRVVPGRMTRVAIVDATGKPWPITNLQPGDTNNRQFIAEQDAANEFKNTFTITPRSTVGKSNISILLAGEYLPFSIEIQNNKSLYHDNPVLRLSGYGPNAEAPSPQTTFIVKDDLMSQLAARVAPDEFELLYQDGTDFYVWRGDDQLYYIVTRDQLIYPSPRNTGTQTAYSAGTGLKVYKATPWPVLTMSNDRGVKYKVELEF